MPEELCKKKKILIVEDNADIASSLEHMLSNSEYEAEAICNGEQAYSKIAKFHPDILILDIFLSGSDGKKIAQTIKSQGEHLPIIMISAHPSGNQIAKESGVEAFLAKPFSKEKLLANIQKVLG